jgi:aspartyl-tRNA(Asn)/glutamyl-tRNA(Gln) amidotransferase subunit A
MTLTQLSAFETAQKIRSGEVKAIEIVQSALAQIKKVDGVSGSLEPGTLNQEEEKKVHAFIQLTEDLAVRQAEKVDRMITNGEEPGLLAGVPLSVKDIFCVEGTNTTAASKIIANFVPPYTATAVERLTAAGALVLGKVNLDEFTFGSSNESSAFQPATNNPWQTEYVPGGSSGGSAASVAAQEVALSLGTDTGGSIRQPAAFCGVVGMKPSYGRVSRLGLIAFASSLDCPGPVARDVRDAALMLQVMAGNDPKDSTSSTKPVDNYLAALEQDVKGLRIGLSPDYEALYYPDMESGELFSQPIQKEVHDAVLQAAEWLAKAGAEIIEYVPMSNTLYGIPTYFVISRVEAASNLHRFDGVKYGYRTPEDVEDLIELYRRSRAEGFGLEPKLRILMGMYVSAAEHASAYYQKALKVRSMIRNDFDQIFDPQGDYRLDALLTPTTATTAFKRKAVYGNSVLMQYSDQMTVTSNHAGVPALTLPGGLDENGLPIGIQLIGNDFREDMILRIGNAYEQITADEVWRKVRPQVLQGEVKA